MFLDEIGDMPLALQAKLRALQDGEVEPVGSNQLARVDVRIIAATSRPWRRWLRQAPSGRISITASMCFPSACRP